MDFGIQLATSAQSWKVAKRAEELGFTHAWFYDTQLLNADLFVAMGAAAMQTTRIRLGTGVLIPSNRIAPVAASALASLNALAPGRIDFGVSTGFTARRTMGLPAITLARLEDYVRVVQGLLRGETVEWSEEGGTHKIRFLNPELGLINLSDPIPLHISAFGPRGRRLTARLGACWMGAMRDAKSANAALADMQKAWAEAGREPKALYATAFGGGCVLAEGEPADSARAKAQAGPAAAMIFHNFVEEEEFGSMGFPTPPQFKAEFDAYRALYRAYQPADARYLSVHRGHLMFLRPEEEALMSAAVIRALTFTGTEAELVEGVRAIKTAGYSQFGVHIRHGQEMSMLENWAEVFAKV
ncbi:MAG TPA: LLM class flavin-dependent oxidoreductase [Stellaceae bacterium]|nr:LLM class flavin-dependent oxidoreductase [Stellaceae bacterium]